MYIKKNINIRMGNQCIFTYNYSCVKQKWELVDTKLKGI